jgi:hypothetical protein
MSKADETTTSRRDLLTRVVAGAALAGAAGVNAVAIGATRPTPADPALKAILEHSEAKKELQAACEANGLDMEDCPRKSAAEDRAMDADLLLFSTRPTTLYGVAALLLYVTSVAYDTCDQSIYEYVHGWKNLPELQDAVANFHQRVAVAFRAIAEGGARG